MAALESELLHRAIAALDEPLVELAFCGRDHADSAVWRLGGADGRVLYLKRHRHPGKLAAERRAYRQWIGALDDTPRLLAVLESEPPAQCGALLLSAVPGETVDRLELAPEVEQCVHRRAGRWLRTLHALPHTDDDPLPLVDALVRRAEATARRARGLVDAELVSAIVAAVTDAAAHGDSLHRVPCHRDFGPRNWLWCDVGDPHLSCIDFEHARPDDGLADLVKLAAHDWAGRPDLADAFMDGYGRRLDGPMRARLHALVGLHGLATATWAHTHGDAAFAALGRQILAEVSRHL